MAPRKFFGSAQQVAQFPARVHERTSQELDPLDAAPQLAVKLLSVKAVADLLGVSVRTVYGHIYENGLPVRHLGSAIRIHPSELDAWTRRKRELRPTGGTR